MAESCQQEGIAMKEQLQALIEQKISEWQRDGIYENIYALSLYVFNEGDDPRRPVAVLGYNTRQQAEQSVPLASDEQETRWNYAFWIQNRELCWGLGDTAEMVSQWVDGLDLEDEEEIAGAFWKLLTVVVKEIHASGLLKDRFGAEIPILIHGLEYDQETARQNLEANGETLDRDFLTFCGLEQGDSNTDWDSIMGATVRWRSPGIQSGPNADWCHIKGKPMIRQKEENPQKEAMITPDIPKKFNCGRQKADMRHVMAFILIIIFVMFTLGLYGIFRIGPGTVPDIEENGLVGQPIAENETVTGSVETEEKPAASGSHEGQGSVIESEQTEKPGQEQDTAAAEDGEENARQWQVYIHPDVPEPLVEVLEQYEKVMKADFTLDDLWDNGAYNWEGSGYVYDEVYCYWPYATEEDWDISIGYSLEDMTGDGIPELIMGGGYYHDETLKFVPMIMYYVGEAGDIQSMETSPYFDMTMYEGGIVEYVSGGVDYTITYYQYSQETQDFELAEALGVHWDNENRVDVEPYRENREIITDGEYAREMLSEEEFQRIREQYTQKKIELEWFPLCRPSWHILVSSGRDYDLYLEGISTDLWLEETGERQLCFSIYDKEGSLVQELVETSPYLPYMPDVYYAENTNIDWDEGWGHHAGNFYFQDMNFDGEEDLVLLWMNIRHSHWKVYLWREEERVFREELPVNMSDEFEGVFCYYNVIEEKKYIDEYAPDGATQTSIYRWRYDEEQGYLCVGALEVYYYRDQWETTDNRNERYQEYFFEDGICVGETEIIPREEISDLWSDLLE